ncbi:hypothetical protein PanWU01x14_252180, partial [Parasponia andersonii]
MSRVLDSINKSISLGMVEFLESPFTSKKIKVVLIQMGGIKAATPNGFHAIFYQKYRRIVGGNFFCIFLEILNEGLSIPLADVVTDIK